MSNTLRRVIKEEMSNILQKADEVDLDSRSRKDRMQPADKSEQGGRWYDNQKKNEGSVRDKLRKIVSEEYETLRDEPETSIDHRSGLRDFDASGNPNAWYMNENGEPDTEKIKEAAKKATKKILREMGEDTFRARAENARSYDGLYQIFQDMRRFMTRDPEVLLERIGMAMGRQELKEAIQYIARMLDMQTVRDRAKNARSTGELVEILDKMAMARGAEKLVDDLIQQMSNGELRNLIQYFDRHYVDQNPPMR